MFFQLWIFLDKCHKNTFDFFAVVIIIKIIFKNKEKKMFFLSQQDSKLNLNTLESKADPEAELILIQDLVDVVRIGKNSIYDTQFEHFPTAKTLTFFGKLFVQLKDDLGLSIYRLQNHSGFLVHNKQTKVVHVSSSLSNIIDFNIIDPNISLLGILRNELGDGFRTVPIIINNDLTPKKIHPNDLDPDKQMYYNLGWDYNNDYYPFGAIIESDDFVADKTHTHYTRYSGTISNVGSFTAISLNSSEQLPPQDLPALAFSDCMVITKLFDDNAQTTLVPYILKQSEYSAMIKEMQSIGRKQLTLSGSSSNGYGVQARIELLDESESASGYKARITRLIIHPNDMVLETYPEI